MRYEPFAFPDSATKIKNLERLVSSTCFPNDSVHLPDFELIKICGIISGKSKARIENLYVTLRKTIEFTLSRVIVQHSVFIFPSQFEQSTRFFHIGTAGMANISKSIVSQHHEYMIHDNRYNKISSSIPIQNFNMQPVLFSIKCIEMMTLENSVDHLEINVMLSIGLDPGQLLLILSCDF